MLLVSAVVVFPWLFTGWISLHGWQVGSEPSFVGLDNYARLAGDARTAVRDLGHTGIAPVAMLLLRDDCAHAGVRVPPG